MLTTLALLLAPLAPQAHAAPGHAIARTSGAMGWIEARGSAALLGQGLDHPWVAGLLELPLAREELEARGFDPARALRMGQALLGAPPLEVLADLTGAEVGVAILPPRRAGAEPGAVLVMRGADADRFEAALERLVDLGTRFDVLEEADLPLPGPLAEAVRQGWRSQDGKLWAAALSDPAALVATHPTDLVRWLGAARRRASSRAAAPGLGGHPGDELRGWLDLDALEALGGLDELRAMTEDPGAHFVLGPALTMLGDAGDLAFHLDLGPGRVELRIRGVGPAEGPGLATLPRAGQRAAASLVTRGPREVGRAVFHRDVDTLLDRRVELFRPAALPGIAEGMANLALVMGGPDGVDELVDALAPTGLAVFEEIDFGDEPRPAMAFPATALVMELRGDDPKRAGDRLVQAFQSVISLQNIERAMQGRMGYLLGLEPVGDVALTRATLPAPLEGAGVDVTYNLAPACAATGRHFVLGTHHGVVRGVVERLAAGELERAETDSIDRLHVAGSALRGMLDESRDLLEMRAVLEEGKSRTRARRELATLEALLDRIEGVELETAARVDSDLVIDLRLTLELAR